MPSTLTTCTACGCTCDDIRLSPGAAGQPIEAAHACQMGAEWFAQTGSYRAVAMVDGSESPLDVAVDRAAQILTGAKLPLVAGMKHATAGAIRAAVALADQVAGCVDWTTSTEDAASTLALQTVGGVTATLGEVAQRADLVLLWGANLTQTHPRHFERYSLQPTSPWIAGRQDRTLVVIDHEQTGAMSQANVGLNVKPGAEYTVLATLRALVAGIELDAADTERRTGVPLSVWQDLMQQMKGVKFGAVIYGGGSWAARETLVALTQLMADLTAETRWVALAAGGAGNKAGAANVLAWQTGYPLGVSLAEGYPQYGPGEWTAGELLRRGEADAAISIADDLVKDLALPAAKHLQAIPTIALDWRDTATTKGAKVVFRTARPGVECEGVTYRADGLALPLRAACDSDYPSAAILLRRITQRCDELQVPPAAAG